MQIQWQHFSLPKYWNYLFVKLFEYLFNFFIIIIALGVIFNFFYCNVISTVFLESFIAQLKIFFIFNSKESNLAVSEQARQLKESKKLFSDFIQSELINSCKFKTI